MVQQKRKIEKLFTEQKSLFSTGNQDCIAICNGKWLQAACQVLSLKRSTYLGLLLMFGNFWRRSARNVQISSLLDRPIVENIFF